MIIVEGKARPLTAAAAAAAAATPAAQRSAAAAVAAALAKPPLESYRPCSSAALTWPPWRQQWPAAVGHERLLQWGLEQGRPAGSPSRPTRQARCSQSALSSQTPAYGGICWVAKPV